MTKFFVLPISFTIPQHLPLADNFLRHDMLDAPLLELSGVEAKDSAGLVILLPPERFLDAEPLPYSGG